MNTKELTKQAEVDRRRLIEVVYNAGAGHIGGDLSIVYLYYTTTYYLVIQN